MSSKRVGLFIDGEYVEHMSLHGFSGMIDYRKLIPFVVKNEGTLVQGHYYTCMPYQQ